MVEEASAGRSGGRLLLVAGLFTLVNNYLPGAGHLNIAVLNAVALAAMGLGGLSLVLPWHRLPPRATLVLALLAFTLLTLGDLFGDVSAYSYAVYYVVVFVWVGISQPPRTSYWLAPAASLAYVAAVPGRPGHAADGRAVGDRRGPVCVLVGEVLARRWPGSSRPPAADASASTSARSSTSSPTACWCSAPTAGCARATPAPPSCSGCRAFGARRAAAGAGGRPPGRHGAGQRRRPAAGVETVATNLPDTDERVVTLRDVSRQRSLDQAKDLFLATTSHELRTPLTAIKGYLHVLQRRWDVLDDDRRLAALATVAERTDALVALTDHLLLGARAGASRHSTQSHPFDLAEVLAEAAAAFHRLPGPGSVAHRLEVHLPTVPLQAVGEPASVRQILEQLLENAVKYSPRGGVITLTARRDGGSVLIEVSDEGIGLPEEGAESLFAPFFQAGDTNTRVFGGVGLGLYIVRELVEAQSGTVTGHNRAGAGATFCFSLPVSTPPAPRGGADA